MGHIPPKKVGISSFSIVRRGEDSYDVFSFSRSSDVGNFATYMQGTPAPAGRADTYYRSPEAIQKASELLDSLSPQR